MATKTAANGTKARGGRSTREAILEAASRLIHVHGYNHTSLDAALAEHVVERRVIVAVHVNQAARRLIHVHGYNHTSLDDVLRESGVGKGNFYYHFKSKEELGYAILDQIIASFLAETLAPCFSDPEGRALAQIRCFFDRVLETQRERNCVGGCPLGNMALELSDVHEGFRARLASVFSAWRERLTLALT